MRRRKRAARSDMDASARTAQLEVGRRPQQPDRERERDRREDEQADEAVRVRPFGVLDEADEDGREGAAETAGGADDSGRRPCVLRELEWDELEHGTAAGAEERAQRKAGDSDRDDSRLRRERRE